LTFTHITAFSNAGFLTVSPPLTCIVSGGALNSTHSLTLNSLTDINVFTKLLIF